MKKTKEGEPEREVSLKELVNFRHRVLVYRKVYPNEKSKLTWGLIKLSDKYEKAQTDVANEVNEKIGWLKVKFASVKDGNLIETRFDYKEGQNEKTDIRYAYTPENKIKLDKEINKLSQEVDDKKIKITPFIVDIPENFDFSFYEVFKKFVFKTLTEEEEMELYFKSREKEQKPTIKPVLN